MAKVPNPDPASETSEAGSSASGDGFDRMRAMRKLDREMAERERQVVAS